MTVTKLVLMLVCLMSVTLQAQRPNLRKRKSHRPFSRKICTEAFPGKEGLMINR